MLTHMPTAGSPASSIFKSEGTVRYLGVEVNDALTIAEQVEV
jgi:hypothetical protein